MIWGKVDIYNIDDIDEKYSEKNDDESRTLWERQNESGGSI